MQEGGPHSTDERHTGHSHMGDTQHETKHEAEHGSQKSRDETL